MYILFQPLEPFQVEYFHKTKYTGLIWMTSFNFNAKTSCFPWHQQWSAFGISVYVQTPTALEAGEIITERGVHFCPIISGSNLKRCTQKQGILVFSDMRLLGRKQFSI